MAVEAAGGTAAAKRDHSLFSAKKRDGMWRVQNNETEDDDDDYDANQSASEEGEEEEEEKEEEEVYTCYLLKEELHCPYNNMTYSHEARIKPGTPAFMFTILLCLGLVLTAGMVSGLQLGLLSLDTNNLQILINAGEPDQQRKAKKILPLVRRHHLLLVTLLVINAGCMEALPIFLDRLVSPLAAIIMSVTLVLMFGEIIPQAICTRFGLSIGAVLAPIVWCLIGLTFVLSWPISKLLDYILGEGHAGVYRRGELKELLKLQQDAHDLPAEQRLTADENRVMTAAMELKEKVACDHMTPMDDVFMLDADSMVDRAALQRINETGHSRLPVYRGYRQNVIGMALTKDLILANPDKPTPLMSFTIHRMPTMPGRGVLYEALSIFQTSQAHMALVFAEDNQTYAGVITLEDVIEELLGVELEDEFDRSGRMAGIVIRANSIRRPTIAE